MCEGGSSLCLHVLDAWGDLEPESSDLFFIWLCYRFLFQVLWSSTVFHRGRRLTVVIWFHPLMTGLLVVHTYHGLVLCAIALFYAISINAAFSSSRIMQFLLKKSYLFNQMPSCLFWFQLTVSYIIFEGITTRRRSKGKLHFQADANCCNWSQ